ncbi:hypothetical protein VRN22_000113 [Proteus mirabilis]|nr:hypothetical protein [Proteus mirabilis]
MELKHSPAPWYLMGGVIKNSLLIDDNHNVVASFLTEIKEEDANLIATAPELLEALQSIQQSMAKYIEVANNIGVEALADGFYLGHAIDAEEKARQAIAKALGQQ